MLRLILKIRPMSSALLLNIFVVHIDRDLRKVIENVTEKQKWDIYGKYCGLSHDRIYVGKEKTFHCMPEELSQSFRQIFSLRCEQHFIGNFEAFQFVHFQLEHRLTFTCDENCWRVEKMRHRIMVTMKSDKHFQEKEHNARSYWAIKISVITFRYPETICS